MSLHPLIERVVRRAYQLGHADLPSKTIDEVRAYYHYPCAEIDKNQIEDVEIQAGVTCRIHKNPSIKAKLPFVVYLRPSAYIFGNIDYANDVCQQLAHYLGCAVVAIEPRLAPECKFPLPFEDCIKAIDYLFDNHEKLGLDPKRAAIWGESSGGNVVSGLCHYYHGKSDQRFARQVLIYPMLDYYHKDYPSKHLYGNGYLMDTPLQDLIFNLYTSSEKDALNPYFSTLLSQKFNDLPTTLLISAQCCPFRDEATAYINRLEAAKVQTFSLSIPGMTHGFFYYARKLPHVRFAQETAANFIKEAFL